MNIKRGFQRVAWVLVVLATPVIWWVAYEASTHRVGYRPKLLTSDFPDTSHPGLTAVLVDDVGVFYFPTYTSKADMEERVNAVLKSTASLPSKDSKHRQSVKEFAAAVRSKYPEYSDLSDLDLTKRIVTKYPTYRDSVNFREFEVEEISEKRVLWASG